MNTATTIELSNPSRQTVAARSTWVSVWVNVSLVLLQLVTGLLAHSQALVADAMHSLSDIFADVVVLSVNRHSHKAADEEHHYGHYRLENAASLVLGLILLVVGGSMLWSALSQLQSIQTLAKVAWPALWVACFTLISKECLFRYLLRQAKSVQSSMLIANAYHARSDAASSLVVALGIIGNLAGYYWLDAFAASLVGMMVLRTGGQFAWQAINDLVDGAIDPVSLAAIRTTMLQTDGVLGLHSLRTRKMGDFILVDAHVRVAPRISVSEGHYIAEQVRQQVLSQHQALDVLIHIDAEEDNETLSNDLLSAVEATVLPSRGTIQAYLNMQHLDYHQFTLHYLDHHLVLEMYFLPSMKGMDAQEKAQIQGHFPAIAQIMTYCMLDAG